MSPPYFLQDLKGNLRFTSFGMQELGPYFTMAGIDIMGIKTYGDYLSARQQASPHFMEWLSERARQWPVTPQFQLLKDALFIRK